MQSQGSTSTQPSFDSLSSSDSFLFSDSEQAEDDTDVFLRDSSPSVIINGGAGVRAHRDRAPESPESQWTCDSFTDREDEGELDQSESKSGGGLRAEEMERAKQSPQSQGDVLFAQKCAELQGFVRPLLELLHGLKRGRFDRGLSSFQQSVAMDRIQRIVGVLQRPNSGEKYLNTLLQVEMMLKMWFPQISSHSAAPPSSSSSSSTTTTTTTTTTKSSAGLDPSPQDTPCTAPHKHRDQLHIPVKKRRLSWTDTDSPTPSPALLKIPHADGGEKRRRQGDCEGESPPPSLEAGPLQSPREEADKESQGKDSNSGEGGESSGHRAGDLPESSPTAHLAPVPSPPKVCPPAHEGPTAANENGKLLLGGVLPPTSRGSPATQDSSISSTTPKKHPKNQKKPIWCQSEPVDEQQAESEPLKSCPGQIQSPLITVEPLTRVHVTPLET